MASTLSERSSKVAHKQSGAHRERPRFQNQKPGPSKKRKAEAPLHNFRRPKRVQVVTMAHDEATISRTLNFPTRIDYPSLPKTWKQEPKNFILNTSQLRDKLEIQTQSVSMKSNGHWVQILGYRTPQSEYVEIEGEGRHKVSASFV